MDIFDHVVNKLYCKTQPEVICGLDDVFSAVYGMLASTVSLRRGDSCMIMGPRSAGKTLMITKVLEKLSTNFADEYLVIRLSGTIHADDKQAVRAIARQIDEFTNNQIDADTLEKASMAATMQNFLTLFEQANFSESTHKSVIFVIEDIDQFSSAGKQTLLYNLLDLSQSSIIGVAVVGLSCRMNAGELLEKRVRSRFSQRLYGVPKPKTIQDFVARCLALLQVDPSLVESFEGAQAWNNTMSELVDQDGLGDIITEAFYTSKDLRQFGARAAPYLTAHKQEPPYALNKTWFLDGIIAKLNVPSSTETILPSLSELDWALLICAARAATRYSIDSVNLVLVQTEYHTMAQQLSIERSAITGVGYRVWSARAIRLAWERLQALELLVATGAAQSGQDDLKMLRPETGLQELRGFLSQHHPLYSWTRL